MVGSVTSLGHGKLIIKCAMSAARNFIYPRKRCPLIYQTSTMLYECSPKGWTNEKLIVTWLEHFVHHSHDSLESPVLLIHDNHNSHTTLESYELCRLNGVTMISLPLHCSHRMWPLDVTCYSTLKGVFNWECNLYLKSCRLLRITPYDLAGLFNSAYSKVATMSVAVSGFKATGIYPINLNVFSDDNF